MKQTEIGLIPDDWEVKSLGDVGEPCMCKRILKEQTSPTGDIPFYKIGTFGGIPDAYISRELFEHYKEQYSYPKKGTLLLSAAGTIGRVVVFDGKDSYFQDSNIVWIENDETQVTNDFLFYCYSRMQWKTEEGGIVSRLYNANLKSTSFISPKSIEEQQRIAKALSDVDALLSTTEKLLQKKRNIKQGTMQELLTGKKRLPGFAKSNNTKMTELGEIPEDWEVKKLGEFTRIQAGGTPSTLFEEYWNGNIRWMNSGELNMKRVYEVEGRITELGLANSSTHLFPKNCVLIGLAGQGKTRGTAAINYVELCTNQSIAAIFPSFSHNSEFLYQNIDNRYNELRELSDGGGGRGGLNLKIIGNLEIALPPKKEQNSIAKILSDMDNEIDLLNTKLEKYRNLKTAMMQQLLTGKIRLV